MSRLRIAMIAAHASPLAQPGEVVAEGRDLQVGALSEALAARGHEVRIYTRRRSPERADQVRLPTGVTVEHAPAGLPTPAGDEDPLPHMEDFGRWLEQAWHGEDFTPDVVHAHLWPSGLAALAAIRVHRRPLVVTYYGLDSVNKRMQGSHMQLPASRRALEQRLGRSADRVIAQCADEAEEMIRCGIPRRSIVNIPLGVDTDEFAPAGPAGWSWLGKQDQPTRLLAAGRMAHRKGYADLIRVLPYLPQAELVVAGGPPADALGDDPVAGQLRSLAEHLRVGDRVRFLGGVPHERMPELYQTATLLACTPWYEPFGIASLEAMATGLPVVAYAVGSLRETVIDGVTGILVPPGDRHSLSVALRRVLADPSLRVSFASAAVDRARSRYQWPRLAAETERVYAAAMAKAVEDQPVMVSQEVQ